MFFYKRLIKEYWESSKRIVNYQIVQSFFIFFIGGLLFARFVNSTEPYKNSSELSLLLGLFLMAIGIYKILKIIIITLFKTTIFLYRLIMKGEVEIRLDKNELSANLFIASSKKGVNAD